MSTSTIGLTEGAGKNLHTDQRTVSATAKETQFVLEQEPVWPTYTAIARDISIAVANTHVLFVQADGTNYTRILKIQLQQSTLAGSADTADIRLFRTTTAGTGGTSVSARSLDGGDTDPYAGICMTVPSSKGTEGNQLDQIRLGVRAAQPMDNSTQYIWTATDRAKPIILAPTITNGLAVKCVSAVASGKIDVIITFSVTPYL